MGKFRFRFCTFVLAGVVALGCASTQTRDIHSDFRDQIEDRQYHAAFRTYSSPNFQSVMKTLGEGAAGFEYQLLLGATAGRGQGQWEKIFRDISIPLQMKTDLVQEIHKKELQRYSFEEHGSLGKTTIEKPSQ